MVRPCIIYGLLVTYLTTYVLVGGKVSHKIVSLYVSRNDGNTLVVPFYRVGFHEMYQY